MHRPMIKKLTQHGNSLALVIDKSILDQIGADTDTRFEISTDGKALILTPVKDTGRGESFKAALDNINARYPKVLKKLAE
jgi:antitoxin component of MazEF toxin-antitoxin module